MRGGRLVTVNGCRCCRLLRGFVSGIAAFCILCSVCDRSTKGHCVRWGRRGRDYPPPPPKMFLKLTNLWLMCLHFFFFFFVICAWFCAQETKEKNGFNTPAPKFCSFSRGSVVSLTPLSVSVKQENVMHYDGGMVDDFAPWKTQIFTHQPQRKTSGSVDHRGVNCVR